MRISTRCGGHERNQKELPPNNFHLEVVMFMLAAYSLVRSSDQILSF